MFVGDNDGDWLGCWLGVSDGVCNIYIQLKHVETSRNILSALETHLPQLEKLLDFVPAIESVIKMGTDSVLDLEYWMVTTYIANETKVSIHKMNM